jgi:ABC-type uncharacterized transport system permease subunit
MTGILLAAAAVDTWPFVVLVAAMAAVIGTAIFVAGIFVGSDAMSRAAGVPTYIADMLLASALLFMVLAILLTKMRVVRG